MTLQVPNPAAVGAGEVAAARVANERTLVGQMGTARRLPFPASLETTRSRAAKIAATKSARPPVGGGAAGAQPAMLKLLPEVAPGAPKAVEMRGTGMTDLVVTGLVVTDLVATDLAVTDLVMTDLAVEGLVVAAEGEATQDGTIGAMGAAVAPRVVPRATTPR